MLVGINQLRSSLREVIGSIQKSSETLTHAANGLEDTEDAMNHIEQMGNMIEGMVGDIQILTEKAEAMQNTSSRVEHIVQELNQFTQKTTEVVEMISAQTQTTNMSAQEIQKAVEIIQSIAEETNLLSLNALEYHRSSEINIASTDLILLLGAQQDVEEDYSYPTDKVEAFFVKRGTAVELYATTLHYAPCNADENGFKDVVVLPRGTNGPLEERHEQESEDRLLTAKNKWLIGHKDGNLPEGSFLGLQRLF